MTHGTGRNLSSGRTRTTLGALPRQRPRRHTRVPGRGTLSRLFPRQPDADFANFVQRLLDDEDRSTLPPHLVPQTNYWLVEGDEFIGRTSLRHELNEHLRLIGGHIGYEIRPSRRRQGYGTTILGLVLPKARQRGLARVLITCDTDNIASRRIIEHHGGMPETPYNPPDGSVSVLRYWIDLESVPA